MAVLGVFWMGRRILSSNTTQEQRLSFQQNKRNTKSFTTFCYLLLQLLLSILIYAFVRFTKSKRACFSERYIFTFVMVKSLLRKQVLIIIIRKIIPFERNQLLCLLWRRRQLWKKLKQHIYIYTTTHITPPLKKNPTKKPKAKHLAQNAGRERPKKKQNENGISVTGSHKIQVTRQRGDRGGNCGWDKRFHSIISWIFVS